MDRNMRFSLFLIVQLMFLQLKHVSTATTVISGSAGLEALLDGNHTGDTDIHITDTNIVLMTENITSLIPNTTTLRLYSNPQLSLFSAGAIAEMPNLITLIIENSNLGELPNIKAVAASLEELRIKNCKVSNISADVFDNMTKLATLEIQNCPLVTFPNVSSATSLITLQLSNNHIDSISASVFSDQMLLQDLYLSNNNLSVCPPIAILTNLVSLELDNNTIQNLSWTDANPMNISIEELPLLRLHLNDNNLDGGTDFSFFMKAKKLDFLSMNNCQFTSVPSFLNNLESLVTLWMHSNKLAEYPDTVQMPELRYLVLTKNNLTSVSSKAFKAMNKLEKIWLDSNTLTTLGNIMDSARPSLYVNLTNNQIICDWNLCWMKEIGPDDLIDIGTGTDACKQPVHLQGRTWDSITKEDLNCTAVAGTLPDPPPTVGVY